MPWFSLGPDYSWAEVMLAETVLSESSGEPAAVHRHVLDPNIFTPAKSAVLFGHMHLREAGRACNISILG